MNFKTTIILLILLAGVGGYLLFTRDNGTKPVGDASSPHTLLDVKSADVTKVAVTSADGKRLVAEKSTDAKGAPVWRLTQPVQAAAETFEINALVDAITGMKSTASVPAGSPNTGVDKPQFSITLTAGKVDSKIDIGDALSVSGGVYVKVAGHDSIDVVARDVLDKLDRPASAVRRTRIVDASTSDIKQLSIMHRDGSALAFEKQGETWRMVKPSAMPADSSAVSDLLFAVTGLTANTFIDDPNEALGMGRPQAVIHFSTDAPTTQPATTAPATTAPAGVTITIGGYDDVQKKNVFASVSDGTLVKVPATILDSLNKKPLDVRDKAVFDADPTQVSKIELTTTTPATTQPVVAASETHITVEKKTEAVFIGPMLPTTKAATGPSTLPATAPAGATVTRWVMTSAANATADDTKMTTLLGNFHPLKADKYLEAAPTTLPSKSYRVSITTVGAGGSPVNQYELRVIDPGGEKPLIGMSGGLAFEIPRTLASELTVDLKKGAAAAASPGSSRVTNAMSTRRCGKSLKY